MVWIDDEVVFARLNTLLTVTKEATDRVIEAALRAEKKAADKFENVQTNVNGLSPNDARGQPEVISKPLKRSGATQISQNRPQPLPTRDDNPSPTRRVHIRGEDPQPDEEGAIPRRAKVEQPIIVKKNRGPTVI